MRLKVFLIFLFITTLVPFAHAQLNQEKKMVYEVMDQIYHFNFKRADALLHLMDSSATPELYNFLRSQYYRWTELPIHEKDGSILETYYRYISVDHQPISLLDSLVYTNNKLLKAEYYYNNDQTYAAFSQAVSLYNLMVPKLPIKNLATQKEWLLPLSLYHYYYDYYKNTSGLLSGMMWFFEKGDKQKGLDGLKLLANSTEFGQTEALIYLSHIYLRLENQVDSAYKYSARLHKLYPDNLKFYELLIESNLSGHHFTQDTENLINTLVNSSSNYYKKYGLVYQTLNSKMLPKEENKILILKTLDIIDSLGGGNHLKSLLYTRLYFLSIEQTDKDYYEKMIHKHRRYIYKLTKVE